MLRWEDLTGAESEHVYLDVVSNSRLSCGTLAEYSRFKIRRQLQVWGHSIYFVFKISIKLWSAKGSNKLIVMNWRRVSTRGKLPESFIH